MELAKKAAELKASRKMSHADCFAAALAKLRKAELVTGDKEFKQVEGEVKILWIVWSLMGTDARPRRTHRRPS
jgi:predicted nucleic acid-binding protein